MKIPQKYVVEMFFDRVAAAKVYQKDNYSDDSALKYYEMGKSHLVIHDESRALLEKLLEVLANEGETAVYDYIRKMLIKGGTA